MKATEKAHWYGLTLKAIAEMKLDKTTDTAHIAALVVAMAQAALERGGDRHAA